MFDFFCKSLPAVAALGLTAAGCTSQNNLDAAAKQQDADARAGWIEPSDGPNAQQRTQIARRYGMFIHFGINTFSGQEWTDGTLPPATYAPTALDTDQWARAARDAGMTYVILIAKHHDGFCLWDSAHTDYDVASSPVPTDVVAAMAQSCRQYGIELGLYYSLWDRNWGDGVMRGHTDFDEATSEAYVQYMNAQLEELLSQYGDVCELWLDGGWVLPREDWQIARVYDHVKMLQPDCLMGVNWSIGLHENPDHHPVRPAQYEEGLPIRYFPSDFRLGDPMLPVFPDPKLYAGPDGQLHYMPFETTVCLNSHWFWHPYDQGLRSVDELERLYEHSTAQDNVLILNSPPNRDGVMDARNLVRLREMAERLGANPGAPVPANLAAHAEAEANSVWENDPRWGATSAIDGNPETRWAAAENQASVTLQLAEATTLDRLRLREYEEDGAFRIQRFAVDAFVGGDWQEIYLGGQVGTSRLIRLTPVRTDRLRLRVLEADGPPSLWHVAVHAQD